MPSTERLYILFNKYIDQTADAAELEELRALLNDISYEETIQNRLVSLLRQTEPLPGHGEERLQALLARIHMVDPLSLTGVAPAGAASATLRRPVLPRRLLAAAALFLGAAALIWLLWRNDHAPAVTQPIVRQDRLPGGNNAVLTLSDGSHIVLDSAHNGVLTQQGNASVTKLRNGDLSYEADAGTNGNGSGDNKPATALFNTLSTPRGGQYRLRLPDGSEVWLNAASSITYPTAFTAKERSVSITGEIYFEIAPSTMPFRVSVHTPSGQEEVEVLGTHFNVKAYADEPVVRTTLLEGSVQLVSNGKATMLRPGQQGQLQADGTMHLDTDADLESVMAWKNGLFHFDNADITEVMRQVARWYDVDIVYEGNKPTEKFDGEIPRDSKLSEVLKILQLSNVHFKLEDKKLTVTP